MLEAWNLALDDLEERLRAGEEVDLARTARIALCSEHHFKRMFSYLSGVPLAEYIRRRRLTLAGEELLERDVKVIDVALKYGYTSPDAFARAFQAQHGATPSGARAAGIQLKAYPRMTFHLSLRGGMEMKVRIVERGAFRIVGLGRRVPIQFDGVNPAIQSMWESLTPAGMAELKALADGEPTGLVSASTNFSEERMEEKGELDHHIGAATTRPAPAGWDALEVAASTWAVFEAVGAFPVALQNVWGRIYAEWFPSSGYELVPGPELLWNESADTSKPDFRSEIWIPVRRSAGAEGGTAS
ncbi:helix-turn-helix domain-containing protein [Paenibacillus albicereus]|uniref:Helix-turn-helix domain-containing protein n=1 Tax=Paenibacillus albicereus TaxID=2726185 RepID=A0A6H2GWH9_9BACL|nr:GyrI-like domain-containing protein [Paenibacillus albicereus]QJC51526.1 helix-turn-helix domain-containing protein [Paenibacillus albicereus]